MLVVWSPRYPEMKYIIPAICLILGIGIGLSLDSGEEKEKHWNLVNEHLEAMYAISDDSISPKKRMEIINSSLVNPPIPNLEYLVKEGEVEKIELVFPSVKYEREVTLRWLDFCEENKGSVLHAYANPQYTSYKPSGEPVFFCVTYIRDGDGDVIRQLIETIEKDNQSGDDNSE